MVFAAPAPPFTMTATIDGGVTFAASEWQDTWINDITVDPKNSNNVYLAGIFPTVDENGSYVGVRVMRSSDGGVTFVAADAGLESQGYSPTTEEIVIDPKDPRRLFALTGAGLFVSRDGAATWTHLNIELLDRADFTLHSLTINPKKPNLLYLTGAAVFELEIK